MGTSILVLRRETLTCPHRPDDAARGVPPPHRTQKSGASSARLASDAPGSPGAEQPSPDAALKCRKVTTGGCGRIGVVGAFSPPPPHPEEVTDQFEGVAHDPYRRPRRVGDTDRHLRERQAVALS